MNRHKQRGMLLIVAVFLIIAAAIIASALVFMVVAGTQGSVSHVQSAQALFIAESGFERGSRTLVSPVLTDRVPCTSITGNANLTSVAFAEGEFTVTENNGASAFYNGGNTTIPNVATLSAAINSTDTIIRVSSLNDYANSSKNQTGGRIMIDREVIDYGYTSTVDADCGGGGTAPCLLGVQRGRDGSTATTHTSGTRVGQYQCALQSEGGVASLASANGKRTLRQAIQLQEAWTVGDISAGGVNGDFNAVHCTASNNCWAVGDDDGGEFVIARWDGSSWTDWSFNPPGNSRDLNDVFCVNANDCWAVGDRDGNNFVFARWNGTAWSKVTLNDNDRDNLNGVHCTASNNCWAVGNDRNNKMIIVRWNGATWSDWSFNPPGNSRDLNDVFCANANDCWAVGDDDGNNFVFARWNGVAWSKVTVTDAANRENLNGVHCVTANDCWAVGDNDAFIHWDGISWSILGPLPSLQRWDTTAWSNATALLPTGLDELNAVSMLNYADGWAVGDRTSGNATIVRWNGSAWTSVPPSPTINRDLEGVHAVSANEAWVVGDRRGCPGNRLTILRWNGSAWQCSPGIPTQGTVDENLRGIHMLDSNNDGVADDGWAVGNRDNNNFVLLRWNNSCNGGSTGTNSWAYCPVNSGNRERLNSVYCVDTNNCWAVGQDRNNLMVILRWTGGPAWTEQSFNPPGNSRDLNAVYCVTSNDCWATGDRDGNNFVFARWNGAAWSKVTVNSGNRENLDGVSCTHANDCWAVGRERNNNFTFVHWDGSAWTSQAVAGAANNQDLNAIDLIGHRQYPQAAWREQYQ